jgi:23S rRNA pseudouridine2605 synthase
MIEKIRLAKYISQAGVASRRKAEQLILDGQVKVDGKIIKEVATLINDKNKILVNDKPIVEQEKVYYLLNKPSGYICSASDPHNPKNVLMLVPKEPRVFPIGRLDKDSEGLLLLTNDGDLAYELTHPKFEVSKKYLVKIDKPMPADLAKKLKTGVQLEEGLAKADQVELKNPTELLITLHQGWKRQIRRMLESLGYKTIKLTRLSEGKLTLNDLKIGGFREISKKDII